MNPVQPVNTHPHTTPTPLLTSSNASHAFNAPHTPHSSVPSWSDFNDAAEQTGFDLIPKGTLVKVRLSIKPGGFDAPAQGWTGGWATQSDQTGSVYLSAEFVVLTGPYAKRKLWSLIGLYSPKGEEWANMGRSLIRAMLNSARGIEPKDTSDTALAARRIAHFGELEGLEFAARIDLEKDSRGDDKNTIRQAIEPGHKDYALLMQGPVAAPSAAVAPAAQAGGFTPAFSPASPTFTPPGAPTGPSSRAPIAKPAWAQ